MPPPPNAPQAPPEPPAGPPKRNPPAPGLKYVQRKPLAPQPANGWYQPLRSPVFHFFAKHVAICGEILAAAGSRSHFSQVPADKRCPKCLAEIANATSTVAPPPPSPPPPAPTPPA